MTTRHRARCSPRLTCSDNTGTGSGAPLQGSYGITVITPHKERGNPTPDLTQDQNVQIMYRCSQACAASLNRCRSCSPNVGVWHFHSSYLADLLGQRVDGAAPLHGLPQARRRGPGAAGSGSGRGSGVRARRGPGRDRKSVV